MFYARINKIKVFNNREGFLGLFNRAEMRIYSYVSALSAGEGATIGAPSAVGTGAGYPLPQLTTADLLSLTGEQRRERLLAAVQAELNRFAQSASLEINGVKDNQDLLFGDSGLVVYAGERIPDELNMQLWMIESDDDVRQSVIDAETILDSDVFKGLLTTISALSVSSNPIVTGAVAIGGVVAGLLRRKLKANSDDLVGYWQTTLSRAEHYPHGLRDRQDVTDTTGNILIDYTLFGFEESISKDVPADISSIIPASPPQDIRQSVMENTPGSVPESDGNIRSSQTANQSPSTETPSIEGFVRRIYPAAQRLYEMRDGLHPLFVTAQAALETGWKIKATGNNIFGITRGASWTGPVNLLLTTDIFNIPDKRFSPMEKIVSVEQLAPDRYRYSVYREFRAYASLEDSLEDHLALLKGPLYRAAWPFRHDPREYARRIAPTYATGPDYAATLVAVIDKVEKLVQNEVSGKYTVQNKL
jgi:flagellar protein FlgJ